MAFKISGFGSYEVDKIEARPVQQEEQKIIAPRKSIVQVRFPGKGMALAYYNAVDDYGDEKRLSSKLMAGDTALSVGKGFSQTHRP